MSKPSWEKAIADLVEERDAAYDLHDCVIAERDEAREERDALKAALERLRDEPVAGAVYRSSWDDLIYDAVDIARQALSRYEVYDAPDGKPAIRFKEEK